MLTSTYTLVALSVEQTTVRAALQSLLDELRALPGDFSTLAAGRAAQLCAALRQVYDNCHWRKLDKFLVPALRRSTAAADGLLEELERLSGKAAVAMSTAEACVGAADHPVPREVFCHAVEYCVGALRSRLEREEKELFPLARTAVGGDAWFAIANQMLAHDAYAQERRGDPGRLRHELVGHAGHDVHGRRHAALTAAH
ncbi:hemerythrin domain-containing protein [Telluria mixta]|uniref:Hemerythrin domain-containing protein n=1 Tax=Telluria mixta TaxID=34071 RepID=A0ABT2BUH9_9BURK|nr:hemerythrin domain-containing protein [Telluria mixta]MCS0628291.1 hemerythrin domain-containing protein [Telluria mixta]WEM93598.1 hemerythrin domain-containing protein [Telluria mixta]